MVVIMILLGLCIARERYIRVSLNFIVTVAFTGILSRENIQRKESVVLHICCLIVNQILIDAINPHYLRCTAEQCSIKYVHLICLEAANKETASGWKPHFLIRWVNYRFFPNTTLFALIHRWIAKISPARPFLTNFMQEYTAWTMKHTFQSYCNSTAIVYTIILTDIGARKKRKRPLKIWLR